MRPFYPFLSVSVLLVVGLLFVLTMHAVNLVWVWIFGPPMRESMEVKIPL